MAKDIKTIAKFSQDALEMALKEMPEQDRMSFQRGLHFLNTKLGGKEKKTVVKRQKLSEEEVFMSYILPTIQKAVQEVEDAEVAGHLQLNVSFNLKTNFASFKLEDIIQEHNRLTAMENRLKSFVLFSQCSRGLLYIELVNKLKSGEKSVKDFVEKSLHVSYVTVMRYITLASLISTYPRLILCGLSFTQLLKHHNRLLKFLMSMEGQDLSSKLALSVEIIAQGEKLKFQQTEMNTMNMRFSTDPDWEFHDTRAECGASEESLFELAESRVFMDEEADLESVCKTVWKTKLE